jgi:hypothetical protein
MIPVDAPGFDFRLIMRALQIALMIMGGAMLLYGAIPMARALAVSNALIDEGGIEPGEMEIMEAWEAWAFAPRFVVTFVIGGILALIGVSLYFVSRRQKHFI